MPTKNTQINLLIPVVVFGTNLILTKEKKYDSYAVILLIPQVFQQLTMCKFSKRENKPTHNHLAQFIHTPLQRLSFVAHIFT